MPYFPDITVWYLFYYTNRDLGDEVIGSSRKYYTGSRTFCDEEVVDEYIATKNGKLTNQMVPLAYEYV